MTPKNPSIQWRVSKNASHHVRIILAVKCCSILLFLLLKVAFLCCFKLLLYSVCSRFTRLPAMAYFANINFEINHMVTTGCFESQPLRPTLPRYCSIFKILSIPLQKYRKLFVNCLICFLVTAGLTLALRVSWSSLVWGSAESTIMKMTGKWGMMTHLLKTPKSKIIQLKAPGQSLELVLDNQFDKTNFSCNFCFVEIGTLLCRANVLNFCHE